MNYKRSDYGDYGKQKKNKQYNILRNKKCKDLPERFSCLR